MLDELKDNPLAAELLTERAGAYFYTAKKMAQALNALREFDREGRKEPAEKRGTQREKIVAEAAELVWFFMIQREAMKLPYYEEIFADFDIPEEVRRRMGPRNVS